MYTLTALLSSQSKSKKLEVHVYPYCITIWSNTVLFLVCEPNMHIAPDKALSVFNLITTLCAKVFSKLLEKKCSKIFYL